MVSAFKNRSIKALMEKAVSFWAGQKGKQRWHALLEEEKADVGLLLLMQQVDRTEAVSRYEVMKALDK